MLGKIIRCALESDGVSKPKQVNGVSVKGDLKRRQVTRQRLQAENQGDPRYSRQEERQRIWPHYKDRPVSSFIREGTPDPDQEIRHGHLIWF